MTPRICLLVAHYPPSAESGARRPYNLVRALRTAGFTVDVLVAAPGEQRPTPGDHGETVIHAVAPARGRPTLLRRVLDRLRVKAIRLVVSEIDPAVRIRRRLGQLVRRTLTEHDAILYVSAPPAGLAALAKAAARHDRPDQRVVLEFRDPWTTEITGPRIAALRSRYERHRVASLSAADGIVAVTNGIAERMVEHGVRRPPVVAINGIPDELLTQPAAAPRPVGRSLRLLYLGEFYLARDPRPLFDALATLRRTATAATGELQLDLVGEVDQTPGGALTELLAARDLTELAHVSHRVPYHRAKQLLADADIFLLLAQHQPRQVPNKLYEYLAFRRPIFAIADADSETARLLRDTGHAATLVYPDSPPEEMTAAMARAIALARQGDPVGDAAAIGALASSVQFTKVVDLLRDLAAAPPTGETVHE
jgi:glycosyltransferase involved in cell wall biosynthesis